MYKGPSDHLTGAYGPGAVYVHMPFCRARCRYCDFHTRATAADDPVIVRYALMIDSMVEGLAAAGFLDHVSTAYIGGGTPTLAGEGLVGIVRTLRGRCPSLVEFTSEANPDSLSADLAKRLAGAGATRLSIGVQSLDERELAALGRIHGKRSALDAVGFSVNAGLKTSADVMLGIPYATGRSIEATVRGLIRAGVDHMSLYPLILEEGTVLERMIASGELPGPDDDVEADHMLLVRQILTRSGFERYEVASYARPGCACAHNVAYWTGVPYLGLGSGASSMCDVAGFSELCGLWRLRLDCTDGHGDAVDLGLAGGVAPREPARVEAALRARGVERVRFTFHQEAADLVRAWEVGAPMDVGAELLDARQADAEDLMLAMRMARGVGPALLERIGHGQGLGMPQVIDRLNEARDAGLVREVSGRWEPTDDGWLMGNRLYGMMWDLA